MTKRTPHMTDICGVRFVIVAQSSVIQNEGEMSNNDKTNATYDTTDPRSMKNCNRGIALEWPVETLLGVGRLDGMGLNQFTRAKPRAYLPKPNLKLYFCTIWIQTVPGGGGEGSGV